MAVFYLIRHGETDAVGRFLAGRTPGVHLNATGRRQAAALATWLAHEPVDRVISSPMERTLETTGIVAESRGLAVERSEALHEFDFGQWTGRTFAELDTIDEWKAFNAFRSGTRAPGGESMIEVQARIVRFLLQVNGEQPEARVAVISHADVIRAALSYFAGVALDFFLRWQIEPGSVTTVAVETWGPRILNVNIEPRRTA